jgi:diguanylate cyclase (GGDEF)-like protein/PAS domain S-box-containing protein
VEAVPATGSDPRARRRRRDADGIALALLVVFTAAFVAWQLTAPTGVPLVSILSNLAGLVPGVFALWYCARTARSHRLGPRARRSWAWLTASLLVFWLGDVAFLVLKVVRGGGLVGASVADLLYLGSYPIALVALATLRPSGPDPGERSAFWLDAAIMALGGGMVAWHLFIQPTLRHPHWDWEAVSVLAYLLGDVALITALAISRLGPARAVGWPFALLTLGVATRFGANALYWHDLRLGAPALAGAGASALYAVAWVAFALGAHARVSQGAEVRARSAEPSGPAVSLLPTVAAITGYVVLAEAVARLLSVDVAVLVIVGVGLTAAVLTRQLVALRAGARLAARRVSLQTEARFRSLVQNASDVVLVVGEDGTVEYHTPSAERLIDPAFLPLEGQALLELVHPEDRAVVDDLAAQAIGKPGSTPSAEWRLRWADGDWHFVEGRAKSVPDDPHLGGLILTLRSVNERKVLEDRLAYQAFHDPLTHLANRVLFSDRLEHALVRGRRGKRPVTVLFIDLDDFKNVNDSFGHAAGDQILVEVSRRLLACVRAYDTAARFGGDEFAVLLEDGGGVEAAREIATRVAFALRAPFSVAGRHVVLGASLGIATSETGGDSASDLLRNADVAMYRAKHSGKGNVVVFEATMQTAVRERLELEADLRGALDRGELAVVFQPIVALGSGLTVGAEALLRWDHRTRGRLRPADFFAAAEASGVMLDLGAWVVEEACRQAAAWPLADETWGLPLVTVNVSPRLLATREFADAVARAVSASRLPPGRLVLELTEGAAVEDAASTFAAMRHLRSLGVRLAIDDFGTGYSALSYLMDMPVDILKLDKLFVDGLSGDASRHLLTRGILDLARALNKLVIAEGIEREEQAARLREYGCTLGQGFLFSRPVEGDVLERRLAGEQPVPPEGAPAPLEAPAAVPGLPRPATVAAR